MPLITRSQAAKEMGVTVQAVYGAIKEGRLSPITDEKGKNLDKFRHLNERMD